MSESNDTRNDVVDKLLGAIDHGLDTVHDKVLRPLILTVRVLSYGFIFFLAALVFVAALVIGLVRLFDVYVFSGRVWITDAALGAAFMLSGLIIWRRRRPASRRK